MRALIIPFALTMLFVVLKNVDERRERLLWCTGLAGVYIVLSTEVLSLFHLLTGDAVFVAWLVPFLLLAGVYIYQRARLGGAPGLALKIADYSKMEWFCLGTIGFILLGTALQAYFSPTDTWDSMTYHMTRVMYWAQSGSLDFYPTMIQRQLHYQPGVEFAILHLQLLCGSDRLANFVQWWCAVVAITTVSLVARELHLDRRGQIFSATIFATVPQVVLQISSTQNDVAEALWLIALVYSILILQRAEGKTQNFCCFQFAVYLALAVFTKGVAYMSAFPMGIWFLLVAWQRMGLRFARLTPLLAIVFLILNAGHYWRCYEFYGSPFGSQLEMAPNWKATNDLLTPATLFSNIVRNLACDYAFPWQPLNMGLNVFAFVLLKLFGIDANDPRTCWWTCTFTIETKPFNEIVTGSPVHLTLFLIALALCYCNKSIRKAVPIAYPTCIISGFLILCLLIRFQPWGGRYHLGWYGLCAPLVTIWCLQSFPKALSKWVCGLCIMSVPYVLFNDLRPLVGADNIFVMPREQQYFYGAYKLRPGYLKAVELIRQSGEKRVGVSNSWNCWEYPLWALLNPNKHEYSIENVEVINGTEKLKPPYTPPPKIMLEILHPELPKDQGEALAKRWKRIWTDGNTLNVYVAADKHAPENQPNTQTAPAPENQPNTQTAPAPENHPNTQTVPAPENQANTQTTPAP